MSELPKSWCSTEIEHILKPLETGKVIQQGWSPQCERIPSQDNEWGVLKTTAIQEGFFLPKENKKLPEHLEPRSAIEIKSGDILMTCAGPRNRCGVTCFVKETRGRLMMSGKMYRFRTDQEKVSSKYLEAFLLSQEAKFEIDKMKTGISDSGLNLTHGRFKTLSVPIAPLHEQKRIVAKIEALFSELDKGVESLKTARAQLKIYRQAVLKHAFEGKLTAQWREDNKDRLETADELLERIQKEREARYQQQLEDWKASVATWENGGKEGKRPQKPRKQKIDPTNLDQENKKWPVPIGWLWIQMGEFSFVTKLAGFEYTDYVQYDADGDLPVIKAENAGLYGFKPTEYSKVYSQTVAHLKRSHLRGGEILVVFVGAGTGNVGLVPTNQQFFLGPNIAMVRPESDTIFSRYIELFLRSPMGKSLILANAKAVAQPSISMGTIRQTPVAIPNLIEQKQIVEQLDETLYLLDRIEDEICANLAKSESLRQSILKKAFSGKLVAQDPNDEPASVLLERIKAEKNNKKKKEKAA